MKTREEYVQCKHAVLPGSGYDYAEVLGLVRQFGYTTHLCARGEEAQAISVSLDSQRVGGSSSEPTAG